MRWRDAWSTGLLSIALAAGGCAVHSGHHHPARAAITTAKPPSSTTVAPKPQPSPACTAAQVSARFAGRNGAGGHVLHYVRFRNIGSAACVLRGRPGVVAGEPGRPDVTGVPGGSFPNGRDPDMAPGEETLLALVTAAYCDRRPGGGGPPDPYRTFAVTLPGGGVVTVRQSKAGALDLGCGLQVSTFWVN